MYALVPTIPGPVTDVSTQFKDGYIDCGDMVTTSWQFDGKAFTPIPAEITPVTTVVIPQITSRQFFIAMARAGYITNAEALAAAQTGAIPASVQTVINTLPADQQLDYSITWAKMNTVVRTDAFINAYATAQGLTSDQVDQFFINAATI